MAAGRDPSFSSVTFYNSTEGCGECSNTGILALQADGKILVGGNFDRVNGSPSGVIARLNPDGSTDPTFKAPPELTIHAGTPITEHDSVTAIAVQSDGKILVGRFYDDLSAGRDPGIFVRLNPDGALDSKFNALVEFGKPAIATPSGTRSIPRVLR